MAPLARRATAHLRPVLALRHRQPPPCRRRAGGHAALPQPTGGSGLPGVGVGVAVLLSADEGSPRLSPSTRARPSLRLSGVPFPQSDADPRSPASRGASPLPPSTSAVHRPLPSSTARGAPIHRRERVPVRLTDEFPIARPRHHALRGFDRCRCRGRPRKAANEPLQAPSPAAPPHVSRCPCHHVQVDQSQSPCQVGEEVLDFRRSSACIYNSRRASKKKYMCH
ncbi:hypothetical protein PVAP13_3KG124782 [Panicum virgatum]|uniref:Uncharacterized protein n=1 Tax=Panicum virgatum TaxID=38727 RepID=A0A8T0UYN0_PANVG|nr:hypothetical protein PVAP13_3KG124782 [Panicum virgatum]